MTLHFLPIPEVRTDPDADYDPDLGKLDRLYRRIYELECENKSMARQLAELRAVMRNYDD